MSRVLALKECGSTPGPQNSLTVAPVPSVSACRAELICPVVATSDSAPEDAPVAVPELSEDADSLHPRLATINPISNDAIRKKRSEMRVVIGSGRMSLVGND